MGCTNNKPITNSVKNKQRLAQTTSVLEDQPLRKIKFLTHNDIAELGSVDSFTSIDSINLEEKNNFRLKKSPITKVKHILTTKQKGNRFYSTRTKLSSSKNDSSKSHTIKAKIMKKFKKNPDQRDSILSFSRAEIESGSQDAREHETMLNLAGKKSNNLRKRSKINFNRQGSWNLGNKEKESQLGQYLTPQMQDKSKAKQVHNDFCIPSPDNTEGSTDKVFNFKSSFHKNSPALCNPKNIKVIKIKEETTENALEQLQAASKANFKPDTRFKFQEDFGESISSSRDEETFYDQAILFKILPKQHSLTEESFLSAQPEDNQLMNNNFYETKSMLSEDLHSDSESKCNFKIKVHQVLPQYDIYEDSSDEDESSMDSFDNILNNSF